LYPETISPETYQHSIKE